MTGRCLEMTLLTYQLSHAKTTRLIKVTVKTQVIKLADTAKVGRGLIKQEITITDATNTALLTL